MAKSIINDILEKYHIDISNFWIKFIIGYILVCFCMVLYYAIIFPIVLSMQNNDFSREKETQLMYFIHDVYKSEKITYFNMFPVIGGDRIFIVGSNDLDLQNKFKNLDWQINDREEDVCVATNNDRVATFDKNNGKYLIVGSVNSKWSEFWYNIYKIYYLKF